jgi:hypothetical protein
VVMFVIYTHVPLSMFMVIVLISVENRIWGDRIGTISVCC